MPAVLVNPNFGRRRQPAGRLRGQEPGDRRPHARVLEPGRVAGLGGSWTGCNAGANLERLRQLGYTDLAGLEINPTAVQELHEAFPSLAGEASVIEGSLERVLPTLETDSVDVIDLLWPLFPRKGERVEV
jgi:hypothetical protein